MDDQTLMRRVVAGDEAAFEELYGRHYEWAYWHAFAALKKHVDADDTVQEAFVQLWLRRKDYDSEKAQPRGFLGCILITEVANAIRRSARHPTTGLDRLACESHQEATQDDPRQNDPSKLTEITNLPGWKYLSDREKAVVTVHYLHPGFPDNNAPHAEVARILGISEANARQIFHRAKKKLLTALDATRASVEDTRK